jgi:hypothetical protein
MLRKFVFGGYTQYAIAEKPIIFAMKGSHGWLGKMLGRW